MATSPRLAGAILVALLAAGATCAQAPAPPAPDPALAGQLVKTGLYLISGGGSNTLLRLTPHGLMLVDGKPLGSYRALMSQVRRINKVTDLPMRVLIVTDHHDNHCGTDAQFQAAGVPIVAQQNTKLRLTVAAAADLARPPVVGFETDHPLRLGGVEVRLLHFGSAHTDGDAVVHFADLKVVALGDLLPAGPPEVDYAAGGSLLGWAGVLEKVLALEFDVVVPATGPLQTRADLQSFKTRVEVLAGRAVALVRGGVARDQFSAQLKTDDLDWHLELAPTQIDRIYAEVLAAVQPRVK